MLRWARDKSITGSNSNSSSRRQHSNRFCTSLSNNHRLACIVSIEDVVACQFAQPVKSHFPPTDHTREGRAGSFHLGTRECDAPRGVGIFHDLIFESLEVHDEVVQVRLLQERVEAGQTGEVTSRKLGSREARGGKGL